MGDISLFSLLMTQIYAILGSNAVNDIQVLNKNIDTENSEIEGLGIRMVKAETMEEQDNILEIIRDTDTRLNQMNDRLDASYELLGFWLPLSFASSNRQEMAQKQMRLQISQIMLEFVSKYLLPLLYGLLGACVYVLRSLSKEIKNLVYTVESDIRFQLRIYLGALAGLAIGWFITEQSAPGLLRSVTPIALAFIAGYSVELMFSAMDTIIDAFAKEAKGKPKGK